MLYPVQVMEDEQYNIYSGKYPYLTQKKKQYYGLCKIFI